MPTASVTHSFSANTLIQSSQANTNFQDLVTFLNNQVVFRDASAAFTAIPSGPSTDPSGDNQFSRKAYVDLRGGAAVCTRTSTIGDNASYQSLTGLWTHSVNNPSTLTTLPDDLQIKKAGWYLVGGSFQVAIPGGSGINNVIRGVRLKLDGTVIAQSTPRVGTNTFASSQGPDVHIPVQVAIDQKLSMDIYQQSGASGALAYTAKMWAIMLVPL